MLEGDIYKSNNYGLVEILNYINCNSVLVRFKNTGYERYADSASIRRGTVKDMLSPSVFGVGYIGDGNHLPSSTPYSRWRHMLSRCYYIKYQRYSRYGGRGVLVCDEWLNYQNFAGWFNANYIEGFELDKDLTIPNSKIYSPKTCCFIPQEINSLIVVSGENDNGLPAGVSVGPSVEFRAFVKRKSKSVNLGSYGNADDAFLAYKSAKENIVKEIAIEHYQIGNINKVVYDNLMSWDIAPYPE